MGSHRTRYARVAWLAALCMIPVSCKAFGNFWDEKKNSTEQSNVSDSVAPTAPTAPSAVAGGSTQINLSWTAATDNITQPTALIYEICYSTAAGVCATFTVSFTTAAGATAYNAAGLTPSTTYFFAVRARDTAGNAGVATAEFSATTSAPGTVNTPTFSPTAGSFTATQLVTISTTTGGATICYTTDTSTPVCGVLPSCNTGATYGSPVNVSVTTTLKAIACKSGDTDSSVASGVFTIDTTAPTVTNVSSSTSNGTLGAGQLVTVQVTFSEIVNVTGTPQLSLATGSPAVTPVNYVSGSGTAVLLFDYTTSSGNFSTDLDYTSTGALSLNGGSIQDVAGNAANLTLAAPGAATSLGANKALVIDAVGPTVMGVSAGNTDGTFGVGAVINVQVTFSESVTVTGSPQINLTTGSPAITPVNYSAGSGTSVLTFNYTVAAGNSSADLDYASTTALILNGGTINDGVGNPATLTLVTPGTPGSLGNGKNLVIDTGGLTPGTALSFSAITSTGMTLNWGAATDDVTPQPGLQYKVVKDDAAITNIDTVIEADAKAGADLLQNWAASITTIPVAGLTAATTYHFAVLVRDGAGNMALYAPASQATSGGGLPKRFVIAGNGTNGTNIYDSATHSFSAGLTMSVGVAGAGGHSFAITSGPNNGKIFIVHGNASMLTSIYDPIGNNFVAGTTLPTNSGAGGSSFTIASGLHAGQTLVIRGQAGVYNTYLYNHSTAGFTAYTNASYPSVAGSHNFLIPSGANAGKTIIIHGGSRYSSIYGPHATTPTFVAGPDVDASVAVGAGGHTFPVNSGTYNGQMIVVRGGNTTGTFLYNPATHVFSPGPALSANAGDGAHAFEISAGPNAGKTLVIHGAVVSSTSLYDPTSGTFSAGPALSTTAGPGAHAFAINGGTHSGKMLIVHGNGGTATSMLEPGPAPAFGFVAGPALTLGVSTGCHSFPIP